MAVEKAHPVPWVELERCLSALNTSCSMSSMIGGGVPPAELRHLSR